LWRERGTAGHVEEAVIAVLHVLKHVEQECFTVACGLCIVAGFLEFVTQGLELFAQHGPPAAITGFFTVRRVPLDNALDSIFCIYQLKQMVVRYLPPTCLAAQPCIPSTLKT